MITIDLASAIPLTTQIEHALRRAIAIGEICPGQELPAVRQLAGDLDVNFNTVARAYRALEARGLVQTSRGRGTFVKANAEIDEPRALKRAVASIRRALADARLAGLDQREIKAILRQESAALWPGR
jgi:GntR family transcriptional regulator